MIVTLSNYADFDKFQNVLFYTSASNIYVHNHLYLEMNTEGTIKMLEEKVIGGPAPPPPPASDRTLQSVSLSQNCLQALIIISIEQLRIINIYNFYSVKPVIYFLASAAVITRNAYT